MTRVAIVGASGRMGRAIVRLSPDAAVTVVCAVAASDVGADVGELALGKRLGVSVTAELEAIEGSGAEVAIDFSTPGLTPRLAEICARAGVALVSGTTGLDDAAKAALETASARVPVLWEPNMSVGVHVLGELVARGVVALGHEVDVEIVETHHRMKVDAPSGTALRLADIAAQARADGSRQVHGREGRPGARPRAEIGMHAVRGGDVIGDHVVHLLGSGERLELTHRATSRDVFAHGSLRAARWIAGRAPGRYGLADVLRA